MTKKKLKSAAPTGAALSPEEFQKLTPEEQLAYVNQLHADKATLMEANKAAKAEAKKDSLPIVEDVPEDEDNEVEAGDYQFMYPTFTWDDNRVISVKELAADLTSSDKKKADKAELIVAGLLARKSGVLQRIVPPTEE